MNSEINPIQLIEKVVLKDRAAFEAFYDRFSPFVYAICLRVLRSVPEAEETVQDIFYQIWVKAENYSPDKGSVEAWVTVLSRSRAIDKLRSKIRSSKNTVSMDQMIEESGDTLQASTPSSNTDTRQSIQPLFDKLSGIQREALELAYFEGLTQSEIAQKLELPLGTVKTRIRDGLKELRKLLNTEKKALWA